MVVKQSTLSIAAGAIFLVLAVLLGAGVYLVSGSIDQQQRAVGWQAESRQLGVDLRERGQPAVGCRPQVRHQHDDPAYFDAYWREVEQTRTRERVAARLAQLETPQEELDLLAESQQKTEPLADSELRAMRLTLESRGHVRHVIGDAAGRRRLQAALHRSDHARPRRSSSARVACWLDAQYEKDTRRCWPRSSRSSRR